MRWRQPALPQETTRACGLPVHQRLGPGRLHRIETMSPQVSRWYGWSLVVALLGWAVCPTLFAQSHSWGDERRNVSQMAPPPPAPVPPNASRAVATVLKYSVWAAGSLKNTMPPAPPDQALHSVLLEIQTSHPENSGLDSLAQPGVVVEVFSSDVLASDLVGKKIKATLKLTGDT